MNTIITTSEAVASAVTLSLATAGDRITSAGIRLKALAASDRLAARGLVATAMVMLSAGTASAQTAGGTGSLDSFLTNVVNLITGTTGSAIAIIAVAMCGLGAMFGALSARAFGGVVLGCAIVFSAAWIVGKITGGAA